MHHGRLNGAAGVLDASREMTLIHRQASRYLHHYDAIPFATEASYSDCCVRSAFRWRARVPPRLVERPSSCSGDARGVGTQRWPDRRNRWERNDGCPQQIFGWRVDVAPYSCVLPNCRCGRRPSRRSFDLVASGCGVAIRGQSIRVQSHIRGAPSSPHWLRAIAVRDRSGPPIALIVSSSMAGSCPVVGRAHRTESPTSRGSLV